MIKYYFFMDDDPESTTFKEPLGLHRWRMEKSGLYLERWNGEEWVESAGLIACTGAGGDNPFERITEAEAMDFLASHTNKENY